MYEDISTDIGCCITPQFFLIADKDKKSLILDPDEEESELIEIGEYQLMKKEQVRTKHKEFVKK